MKKDKIIKEIAWSSITKAVTFVLFLSTNVFLARALGVESFGIWSFFFSIFTIILLFSYFGINASTRKYIAQYNKTVELNDVLRSSAKLRVIFSFAFMLLFLLFHRPLAVLIGRSDLLPLFLFSIPLLFLSGLVEFLKNVFIGLHRIKYNFITNLSEYGLKLLFTVLILSFSLEIFNIITSFTAAAFITSIIGFYLLYKHFYLRNPLNGKKDFTKEILNYSVPLFLISIGFLIATEVDTLMLGLLSTNTEVGIYAVAKQIVIKLPHISLVMVMGVMPVFAKLNDDNKKELKKLFYGLLRINAIIFFPIVIVILLFSHFFIPLIFGIEYHASILPLRILTVYLICYSFSVLLSSFLDYRGLARRRAINLFLSIILNIVLNLVLIPRYGAIGAAISTSVSYIPYLVLNWFEANTYLRKI